MKRFGKRLLAVLLVAIMVMPAVQLAADDFILRDEVRNVFTGRPDAASIIANAQFDDLWGPAWPQEMVARGVALNVVQGNGRLFRPNDMLTQQEALRFIIGATDLGFAAAVVGTELAAYYGITDVETMLSLGVLYLLSELELVVLDGFNPDAFVTREEIASLLFSVAVMSDPGIMALGEPLTHVYGFSDWRDINALYFIAVEHMVANRILNPIDGAFMPNRHVTRGEMAQIMSSFVSMFIESDLGRWQRSFGTVAAIRDAQYTTTGEAALWRNIYVRVGDGTVDVLQYQMHADHLNRISDVDAPVFMDGLVTGLGMLREGDTIEFITDPVTNTVLYVNVLSQAVDTAVVGQLFAINRGESTITIRDANDVQFVYSMAEGL